MLSLAGTVITFNISEEKGIELLKKLRVPPRILDELSDLPQGTAIVRIDWRKRDFENATTPFIVNVETAVEKPVSLIAYEMPSGEEVFRRVETAITRRT